MTTLGGKMFQALLFARSRSRWAKAARQATTGRVIAVHQPHRPSGLADDRFHRVPAAARV